MKNTVQPIFKPIFLSITLMVVAFTVISCSSSIVYKNAQPSGGRMIKKIPNRHQGKYIDDKDTLTLLKTAFILDGEKIELKNDSVLFKRFKKNYVLSILEDSIKGWDVFLVKMNSSSVALFTIVDEAFELEALEKLFTIDTLKKGSHKYYMINPTRTQFKTMIKQNLYSPVYSFKKLK